MSKRLLSLASAVLACALGATPALAGPPSGSKIDRGLQDALRSGAATQRVIITVKKGDRTDIRKALQAHGDHITFENPLTNSLSATIHSEDVQVLADHPWVEAVSIDAKVTAGSRRPGGQLGSGGSPSAANAHDVGDDDLRETLGLPAIATGTTPTGKGVTVALIDSGIQPSDDVPASRIKAFFDFTKGGVAVNPFDDYGHGTHVAGLIGASGKLSNYQWQGIAPDVSFIGLKVLDGTGQGNTSDVINAIEFIVDNNSIYHVNVINLSLGHPIFAPAAQDPLVQAVEKAVANGIVVVASAGNFGQNLKTGRVGYAGITSPGNAPSAITAGAVDTRNTVQRDDDRVASYSSRGPTWYDGFAKPDVVAPGSHLVSDAAAGSYLVQQLPGSMKKAGNGRDFLDLSGTSMAAGVTTGVVATLLDANLRAHYEGATPLAPNGVKAILEYTAIPVGRADVLTQGTGEINANGGDALASAIDTSAQAGEWWLRNSVSSQTMLVDGRRHFTYSWAANIVWGNNIVWGDLLFYNLKTWSQNIVWGDNIVWANNIVWGNNIVWANVAHVKASNIVWGNNIVWANNIVWGNSLIGLRSGDNIVWGNGRGGDNIVWGNVRGDDNIVWGNLREDNIVWGNLFDDNIVWGNSDDNIVWGNDDNIVWGNAVLRNGAGQIGGIF